MLPGARAQSRVVPAAGEDEQSTLGSFVQIFSLQKPVELPANMLEGHFDGILSGEAVFVDHRREQPRRRVGGADDGSRVVACPRAHSAGNRAPTPGAVSDRGPGARKRCVAGTRPFGKLGHRSLDPMGPPLEHGRPAPHDIAPGRVSSASRDIQSGKIHQLQRRLRERVGSTHRRAQPRRPHRSIARWAFRTRRRGGVRKAQAVEPPVGPPAQACSITISSTRRFC
jgi:hypothetical protein